MVICMSNAGLVAMSDTAVLFYRFFQVVTYGIF